MFRFLCVFLFVAGIYVNENGVQSAPAFEIDQFDHRIVGGSEVDPNKYKYFAIFITDSLLLISSCGCFIIAETVVLTAAHCVSTIFIPGFFPIVTVQYGMSSYSAGDGTVVQVIGIKPHPQYNPYTLTNDIALAKLEKKVTITSFAPLPIQNEQLPAPSTLVTIIGFGLLSEGGSPSDKLYGVDVPLVAQSKCEESYGAGEITENMFCAGEEGKDSCQGDSGGPVILKNGTVVGIVSWGIGCARKEYPGVNTKVAMYINWIKDNKSIIDLI